MWKLLVIATCALFVSNVLSRPTNEPTKITLSSTSATTETPGVVLSMLQQGEAFINRIRNSIRLGRGRLVNSAILARNIIAEKAETALSEAQNNIASIVVANTNIVRPRSATSTSKPAYETAPFAQFLPPRTRETARLEEPRGQALFEFPINHPVEKVLENFLRPTPIVDGIKEHEKYGNSGDQFASLGRALVNGFEGLSNVLNTILDAPVNVAKQTSRGLTEALNQLGSRIVGLQ